MYKFLAVIIVVALSIPVFAQEVKKEKELTAPVPVVDSTDPLKLTDSVLKYIQSLFNEFFPKVVKKGIKNQRKHLEDFCLSLGDGNLKGFYLRRLKELSRFEKYYLTYQPKTGIKYKIVPTEISNKDGISLINNLVLMSNYSITVKLKSADQVEKKKLLEQMNRTTLQVVAPFGLHFTPKNPMDSQAALVEIGKAIKVAESYGPGFLDNFKKFKIDFERKYFNREFTKVLEKKNHQNITVFKKDEQWQLNPNMNLFSIFEEGYDFRQWKISNAFVTNIPVLLNKSGAKAAESFARAYVRSIEDKYLREPRSKEIVSSFTNLFKHFYGKLSLGPLAPVMSLLDKVSQTEKYVNVKTHCLKVHYVTATEMTILVKATYYDLNPVKDTTKSLTLNLKVMKMGNKWQVIKLLGIKRLYKKRYKNYTVLGMLEDFQVLQNYFVKVRIKDQDKSGIGEYGHIAELLGLHTDALRVKKFEIKLKYNSFLERKKQFKHIGNGVFEYKEYQFKLYLPEATGTAGFRPKSSPNPADAEFQEKNYILLFWKKDFNISGETVYFITAEGSVYSCLPAGEMLSMRELTPEVVFEGKNLTGKIKKCWKTVR